MKIANFEIGKSKTFIIAELSANHNQDYEIAMKSIKAIKEAGADAVKLQTYTADTITLDCENEYFQIKHGTIWDGTTLHKLYQQAYTPWDWHKERIRNWVRAQANPYPGAYSYLEHSKIIIDEISFADSGFSFEMPNGLVLSVNPLLVKTPNGVVKLEKIRETITRIEKNQIFK